MQIRDLPSQALLAVTVWQFSEGLAEQPLGGATMRLFSKKGRLKAGQHRLCLWVGKEADPAWPSSTPGKGPLAQRGDLG